MWDSRGGPHDLDSRDT